MAYRVTEEGRTPSYGVMGSRGTGDWLNRLYTLQPTVSGVEINPVAGTMYPVVEVEDVKLYWVKTMNNAAIGNRVDVIIDDTTYTGLTAAAAGTWYSIFRDPTGLGDLTASSTDAAGMYPFMYFEGTECRELVVEHTSRAAGACTITTGVTYGIL